MPCRLRKEARLNDDMRLIRRIQRKGDRAAAETLIDRYYDEIYRYICRQTANKEAAMDVTQVVFISMLGTISRFDGKRAGFRTYLYKIATNKTVDYFRSRAIQISHVLDVDELELPDETDFIRRLEQEDLAGRVLQSVNLLPAEIQQIFRLKFYGEYTFAQIGVLLSMPESSVKSKYYRLLNALRKEFENENY
jgi:RNA polymerase sigma-70 factor (ECF subfamily)